MARKKRADINLPESGEFVNQEVEVIEEVNDSMDVAPEDNTAPASPEEDVVGRDFIEEEYAPVPEDMEENAKDVVVDDAEEQPGASTEKVTKGSISEVIAARAAGRVLKPQAPTSTPAAETVPAGERTSRIKEMIAMRSTQKNTGSPMDVIRQRIHGYSGSASVRQIIQQRRMKQ